MVAALSLILALVAMVPIAWLVAIGAYRFDRWLHGWNERPLLPRAQRRGWCTSCAMETLAYTDGTCHTCDARAVEPIEQTGGAA